MGIPFFRTAHTVVFAGLLMAGCAHYPGPREPAAVARKLGYPECQVSQPMRRYETLDYSDLIGDPTLAESPKWTEAMSVIEPGDDLRYVYCRDGRNFFGLFRGTALILKFGGMIYD